MKKNILIGIISVLLITALILCGSEYSYCKTISNEYQIYKETAASETELLNYRIEILVQEKSDCSKEYNILFDENEKNELQIEELTGLISSKDAELIEVTQSLENAQEMILSLEDEITKQKKTIEELNKKINTSQNPVNVKMSENYISQKCDWNLLNNSKDYINVDPSYYYALYGANVIIKEYNSDKKELNSYTKEASEGIFITFSSKCSYVTISGATYFVSSGIKISNPTAPAKGLSFYVISPNSPAFISINDAVQKVKTNGTILVLPGTYCEHVESMDKTVNIIGTDKNQCQLISYDMDYYTPPLEISAGSVRNMTIKTVNNGTHKDTQYQAYGIHIEGNNLYGKTLLISNCNISSDFNAGIGMGLRKGTVTIQNCSLSGTTAGLFFHDADDTKYGGIGQNLIMTNCTVAGINAQALNKDNSQINLTFTNNNITSFTGVNLYGQDKEGCLCNLKDWYLIDSSGNNLDILNN